MLDDLERFSGLQYDYDIKKQGKSAADMLTYDGERRIELNLAPLRSAIGIMELWNDGIADFAIVAYGYDG